MLEPASTGAAAVATAVTKRFFDGLAKQLSDQIWSMTSAAADRVAVAFRKGFSEYT